MKKVGEIFQIPIYEIPDDDMAKSVVIIREHEKEAFLSFFHSHINVPIEKESK